MRTSQSISVCTRLYVRSIGGLVVLDDFVGMSVGIPQIGDTVVWPPRVPELMSRFERQAYTVVERMVAGSAADPGTMNVAVILEPRIVSQEYMDVV